MNKIVVKSLIACVFGISLVFGFGGCATTGSNVTSVEKVEKYAPVLKEIAATELGLYLRENPDIKDKVEIVYIGLNSLVENGKVTPSDLRAMVSEAINLEKAKPEAVRIHSYVLGLYTVYYSELDSSSKVKNSKLLMALRDGVKQALDVVE